MVDDTDVVAAVPVGHKKREDLTAEEEAEMRRQEEEMIRLEEAEEEKEANELRDWNIKNGTGPEKLQSKEEWAKASRLARVCACSPAPANARSSVPSCSSDTAYFRSPSSFPPIVLAPVLALNLVPVGRRGRSRRRRRAAPPRPTWLSASSVPSPVCPPAR